MSNIYAFALPAVRHYQIPHALDKWLNSVTLEEIRLLHLVHSEAERTSRSEVPLSTDQICGRTGIHRTNISRVRRALEDYGLLLTRKEGRQYVYIVSDPERKTAVPDKTSLMSIDFTHLSASVMTSYLATIVAGGKPAKAGIVARCPLPKHNDTTASFTMDVNQGGKWWCRGCGKSGSLIDLEILMSENAVGATISPAEALKVVTDKLRALGLGRSATGKLVRPPDIVFSYVDELGEVIFEVVRKNGRKDKTVQRRPDPKREGRYAYDTDGCRNILFNLPQILEADTVLVVEGESDADKLSKLGLRDDLGDLIAVTTCRNGAGSWLREHSVALATKRVILCGDTDEPGLRHMVDIQSSLESLGVVLTRVELPGSVKDVSHFLESRSVQEFINLVEPGWLETVEAGTECPIPI
jgi:hypothetical protein